MPDLVDASSSDDDSSSDDEESDPISGEDAGEDVEDDVQESVQVVDFLTDDEAEQASDHDDEYLQWDQPKSWQKDKQAHPLIASLGEAQWRMPAQRGSVPSQPTGPEQDPTFMTKVYDVCMHM